MALPCAFFSASATTGQLTTSFALSTFPTARDSNGALSARTLRPRKSLFADSWIHHIQVPQPARNLRTRASLPTLFRPVFLTDPLRDDCDVMTAVHRMPGRPQVSVINQYDTLSMKGQASASPTEMHVQQESPRASELSKEDLGPRQSSPSNSSVPSSSTTTDETSPADTRKMVHRRPKMLRLTPAHSSAPQVPTGDKTSKCKVAFPATEKTKMEGAQSLHPGSRRAMVLKAATASDAPPGLQLDLSSLPVPSIMDKHNPASTSTLPDLVRKKSGEPVKSSLKHYPISAFPGRIDSLDTAMMRAKSVPNTPTLHKAVHFNNELEQIKFFKHRQRPSAVSRDGSPEHTETETEEEKDFPYFPMLSRHSEIPSSPRVEPQAATSPSSSDAEEQLILRLPNFPSSTRISTDRDLYLERAFLADDLRSVKGTIHVRNIAFEKWVAVRFTLDNWNTVNEVSAEYAESVKEGTFDRFVFSIKLNELLNWPRGSGQHETKSMFLCLRYRSDGQELWDNNGALNYQLDFRKRPKPQAPLQSAETKARVPTTPTATSVGRRSVTSPPSTKKLPDAAVRKNRPSHQMMEDLKRELSKLSADEDDVGSDRRLRIPLYEPPRRKSPPVSPGNRSGSPTMWTARYDFESSLKKPATTSRSASAARPVSGDYFSARSATPTGNSSQSLDPTIRSSAARSAFALAGGMMSPGIGEMVQHDPTNASMTPSPGGNTPTLLTPTRFNVRLDKSQ